jgi:hypothetical protein
MGIELWSVVVVGLAFVGVPLYLMWDSRHTLPPNWEVISSSLSGDVPQRLSERGFDSCITAYSIKHGYLPTEVLANYETINSMANFSCHFGVGLILATGDVVKITLSAYSDTNDLTFKGNANDTDK